MKKLVYVAPLKWRSYSQRPHFMMRYLADTSDLKILWIEPFPVRLPKISDVFRRHDVYNQGTKEHENIKICSHRPVPVEPLVNCQKIYQKIFLRKVIKQISEFVGGDEVALGIGKPCCLAKVLLESGMFCHSFYDAMDDYPEFHTGISGKYVAAVENFIAISVDEVFVSSHFLRDKFRSINEKVQLIQNGYDDSNMPLDAVASGSDLMSSSEKVIGYVGTIYHWFDWDLVISMAELAPTATIKLIGPVLGDIPNNLPVNIFLLPPCSNEDAMRHMRSFDVGFIPFLRNNATRAVDPIKYYEYRALNLPVISTLFGDMQYKVGDPGLFLVSDFSVGALTSVVDSALKLKAVAGDFELREASAWSSRFKNADILGEYLRRK